MIKFVFGTKSPNLPFLSKFPLNHILVVYVRMTFIMNDVTIIATFYLLNLFIPMGNSISSLQSYSLLSRTNEKEKEVIG